MRPRSCSVAPPRSSPSATSSRRWRAASRRWLPPSSPDRPSPRTFTEQASVLEALALMLRRGHRALVVVDPAGRAVGLLTLAAAAAALLGRTDVPSWLPALRMALHLEITLD
ncbi:MAG: CBS domain-containing protein [Actinobacteria bacterium]|nr:CBS domain-containing protein [Actinomycetota bacterium]MBM3679169.1 CBS domain-containing protein [Actinomycetota bacterium]